MSALKICPQCGTEYELDQRFCPRDGSTLRMQDAGADLVGTIVADRYHVIRKLGEGGMGQVYLAEHVRMGRKSALKVMHPGMVHDADAISRFNREAANASRINHANVAAIYDFGETGDGVIYLAMEYIEGEPLTKLLERQGALPPARAASIVDQTAQALSVAHEFGIVHRDLKPDNIMVAKNRDGSDCVKVVDFGIAKAANSDAQKVTRTGLVVGTPEYMSPEQLAGDKLDGRSDIYSLGLVAFTMLTGKLPFPSETVQESMIMRLTDSPRTLAEMKPDTPWPDELQRVMDRALSREVAGRYQHAGELGRDFTQVVAAMPATAMSEAGTQVIGAAADVVPRTRVAGGGGAGQTVKVPAPSSGRPAATRPLPADGVARPPRSRVPMLVGGAIVTAGLAAAGFTAVMKNTSPEVTADTARFGTSTLPSGPDSTRLASATRTDTPAVEQLSRQGTVVPRPRPAGGVTDRITPPPADPPPVNVDGELARVAGVVDANVENPNRTVLRRALDDLGALESRLSSPAQRYRAAVFRVQALALLGEDEQACGELLRLKSQISDQSRSRTMVGSQRAQDLAALLLACEPGSGE